MTTATEKKHTFVNSSMFTSAGYDDQLGNLSLTFKNGSTFIYEVPEKMYEDLLAAPSAGKFYNAEIKGKFDALKVGGDEPKKEAAPEVLQPEEDLSGLDQQTAIQRIVDFSMDMLSRAKSLIVKDARSYSESGDLLLSIQTNRKAREKYFKGMKDPAYAAWKAICAKENEAINPLIEAEKALNGSRYDYDKAEKEAREKAEAEINRRKQEEALQKAKEESERLALEEASKAEAEGDHKLAAAIIENPRPVAPVYVPPVILPKQTPKTEGVAKVRVNWKFEVVNAALVPREYLTPDLVKIGGVVRAMKDMATNIPGIRIWDEGSYSSRQK